MNSDIFAPEKSIIPNIDSSACITSFNLCRLCKALNVDEAKVDKDAVHQVDKTR